MMCIRAYQEKNQLEIQSKTYMKKTHSRAKPERTIGLALCTDESFGKNQRS
jgi:hypothetical protein